MTFGLRKYGLRIEFLCFAALSPGRVAHLRKNTTAKSAQHLPRLIVRKPIVAMREEPL
jgi:hypothetical protein